MTETAPAPARTGRGWDRLRLVLAVVWLGLLLTAVVGREQEADLERLYADVRSGQVERVELVGGLEPYEGPGERGGSAQLDVRWRSGGDRLRAELVEVAGSGTSVDTGGRQVVVDDVAARLRALDPGLQVARVPYRSGWSASVLGVPLPGVLVPVALVAFLATLALLVNGPQPWRATRWAWFWLLGVPGGAVALCLLSGPTPLLPVPGSARRLTGGWSFLLSGVLTAAVGSLLGVDPTP